MRFEEFTNAIKELLEEEFPLGKVVVNRVTKNNGVIYTGVTIERSGHCVSPTIYLESYYNRYKEGESLDLIIRRIIDVYNCRAIDYDFDIEFFNNYDSVKDMLRCKIINKVTNAEYLKDVPYEDFLDLAIVPYCYLDCDVFDNRLSGGSITVKYDHMKMWKVDKEKLLKDAMANTLKVEGRIESILDTIKRIKPDLVEDLPISDDSELMYVFTNNMNNGAVCMTNETMLKSFCEKIDSDIYIIPSSINEVLLVPINGIDDENILNQMVCEVNSSTLDPVEVLSDHVYYFSKENGYLQAV